MAIYKLYGSEPPDGEDPHTERVENIHSLRADRDKVTLWQKIKLFFLGRFVIFLLFTVAAVFALGLLGLGIVNLGFCLVTLFKTPFFIRELKKNMIYFKVACIIMLGMFIAVFSPFLGISLIFSYLLINNQNQSVDPQTLANIQAKVYAALGSFYRQ
jgi:hypothetical protein